MSFYLVRAKPKQDLLDELANKLKENSFLNLIPFGKAITYSLKNARLTDSGLAIWEEEDYCIPPLFEEKKSILDFYFSDIQVEKVKKNEGWNRISNLNNLFPHLE